MIRLSRPQQAVLGSALLALAIAALGFADAKISQLTAYGTQHADDLFAIVDVHDTTMAASGTDKKATVSQIFGGPSNGNLIAWEGVPVPVTVGSGLTLSGTGPYTLTASGAGTVNSGTTGQVAYYAGNGTAVSGESLSALIDSAIGSTQGSILYRGASAWSALGPGTSGYALVSGGAAANPSWASVSGTGTVTSVGLTMPGVLFNATVTGSPVTTSGTLAPSLLAQIPNVVFAGPANGVATAPTFRALVGADLPAPSASTLGGVQSAAAVSHQWIDSISTAGVPHLSQPTFPDLTGTVTIGQGGTGKNSATAAFGALSPLTTKGDLLAFDTGNNRLPIGADGQVLTADSTQSLGIKWATPTTGTVTSVGMTVPSWLSVSGSPVTTSGTLAVSAAGSQTANQFLASPNGSTGAVGLRAIAAADLPATGLTITQHAGSIVTATDGATVTFDLSQADWQQVQISGNRTFALSNPAVGQQFTLIVQQDATGSRTVTWFSGILWAGGSAPTLTTTASKRDVLTFKCISAGVYLGFVAGQNL